MNKKPLFITVSLFIFGVFFVFGSVSGAEPGTSTDPLVSKSYVDQRINEILGVQGQPESSNNESSMSPDELMLQIDFLINERMKSVTALETPSYVPVSVLAGQTLLAAADGTEVILRRGKGSAVTGSDGIVDATAGLELYNSNNVTINHLVIIPRADGRGIKVSSDAWFLVKGAYSID